MGPTHIEFPKIEEIFPESLKATTRMVECLGLPSREMPDSVIPFVLKGINEIPADRVKKNKDPYAPWFPVDQSTWKADQDATKCLFLGWRGLYGTPAEYWDYLIKIKKWSGNELPEDMSLMAIMRHTVRDRSMDPHPNASDVGSLLFFGGWRRKLDPSARLDGPLWIGRNVAIRSSAKLIGPVLIGDDALIDSSTALTRSILGDRSMLEGGVRAKDAIIGSGVTIGSGTKLLNQPLRNGVIEITDFRAGLKRVNVSLERRKQGPFIGDGCSIGANAVIEAGTILLPGCVVGHGEVIRSGVYAKEDLEAYRR